MTQTYTQTPTGTQTRTPTPTVTQTYTQTPTGTQTRTPTPTVTQTLTPTVTQTQTTPQNTTTPRQNTTKTVTTQKPNTTRRQVTRHVTRKPKYKYPNPSVCVQYPEACAALLAGATIGAVALACGNSDCCLCYVGGNESRCASCNESSCVGCGFEYTSSNSSSYDISTSNLSGSYILNPLNDINSSSGSTLSQNLYQYIYDYYLYVDSFPHDYLMVASNLPLSRTFTYSVTNPTIYNFNSILISSILPVNNNFPFSVTITDDSGNTFTVTLNPSLYMAYVYNIPYVSFYTPTVMTLYVNSYFTVTFNASSSSGNFKTYFMKNPNSSIIYNPIIALTSTIPLALSKSVYNYVRDSLSKTLLSSDSSIVFSHTNKPSARTFTYYTTGSYYFTTILIAVPTLNQNGNFQVLITSDTKKSITANFTQTSIFYAYDRYYMSYVSPTILNLNVNSSFTVLFTNTDTDPNRNVTLSVAADTKINYNPIIVLISVVSTIFPTLAPTTFAPTTLAPTTGAPTTFAPTTRAPTTLVPTTLVPTTLAPTTRAPTTLAPTTLAPTTTKYYYPSSDYKYMLFIPTTDLYFISDTIIPSNPYTFSSLVTLPSVNPTKTSITFTYNIEKPTIFTFQSLLVGINDLVLNIGNASLQNWNFTTTISGDNSLSSPVVAIFTPSSGNIQNSYAYYTTGGSINSNKIWSIRYTFSSPQYLYVNSYFTVTFSAFTNNCKIIYPYNYQSSNMQYYNPLIWLTGISQNQTTQPPIISNNYNYYNTFTQPISASNLIPDFLINSNGNKTKSGILLFSDPDAFVSNYISSSFSTRSISFTYYVTTPTTYTFNTIQIGKSNTTQNDPFMIQIQDDMGNIILTTTYVIPQESLTNINNGINYVVVNIPTTTLRVNSFFIVTYSCYNNAFFATFYISTGIQNVTKIYSNPLLILNYITPQTTITPDPPVNATNYNYYNTVSSQSAGIVSDYLFGTINNKSPDGFRYFISTTETNSYLYRGFMNSMNFKYTVGKPTNYTFNFIQIATANDPLNSIPFLIYILSDLGTTNSPNTGNSISIDPSTCTKFTDANGITYVNYNSPTNLTLNVQNYFTINYVRATNLNLTTPNFSTKYVTTTSASDGYIYSNPLIILNYNSPTTLAPTTLAPTTLAPTTLAPTTLDPTTLDPTTFYNYPSTAPLFTGTGVSNVLPWTTDKSGSTVSLTYTYTTTKNISGNTLYILIQCTNTPSVSAINFSIRVNTFSPQSYTPDISNDIDCINNTTQYHWLKYNIPSKSTIYSGNFTITTSCGSGAPRFSYVSYNGIPQIKINTILYNYPSTAPLFTGTGVSNVLPWTTDKSGSTVSLTYTYTTTKNISGNTLYILIQCTNTPSVSAINFSIRVNTFSPQSYTPDISNDIDCINNTTQYHWLKYNIPSKSTIYSGNFTITTSCGSGAPRFSYVSYNGIPQIKII